jgi:hypothetical protein
MQTDRIETEGITALRDAVAVDAAYKAATEFLNEPALPASISWSELELRLHPGERRPLAFVIGAATGMPKICHPTS